MQSVTRKKRKGKKKEKEQNENEISVQRASIFSKLSHFMLGTTDSQIDGQMDRWVDRSTDKKWKWGTCKQRQVSNSEQESVDAPKKKP